MPLATLTGKRKEHPLRSALCVTAFLLGMLTVQPLIATATERGKVLGTESFDIPGWFKSSFLEIAEDAIEAGEANRHVLLFFHLNDCPYCSRMLRENFITGPNAEVVQQHFDVIELNIKGDREVVFDENTTLSEKDLASALKVMYTPAMIFVDPDNDPVLRIDGYRDQQTFRTTLDFVINRAYRNMTLTAYTAANSSDKKYTFREHPAFLQTNDLKSFGEQPFAVVFEDENCTSCNEVHDNLLVRDDVKDALGLMPVIRLDAMSDERITDVQGKQTSAKEMVASLGLKYRPAFVLYDQGVEVLRIDSRLYSWYFNGFFEWVAGRHYQDHPQVFGWLRAKREKLRDQGHDVSYSD